MLSLALTQAFSSSAISGVSVPNSMRFRTVSGTLLNFRMVSEEPPTASGGNDGVDAGPVLQPGIHEGRGLVDAAAHLGNDALDDLAQVVLGAEPGLRERQLAFALDVDLVHPVDHDFRDGRVVQEPLQRAVAQHVVGHVPDQP